MMPEMETAVPVGAGNGGKAGKLGSPSENYNYSSETLAASSPVLFRPAFDGVAE
jgi:hypothetical protein